MRGSTWLVVLFCALGAPGEAGAQAAPGPRASRLWLVPDAGRTEGAAHIQRSEGSHKERGLLIGALVGGVGAALLGNQVCHAYGSSSTDGCAGTTLWWAALGGMLGGLIGAAGGGEPDS